MSYLDTALKALKLHRKGQSNPEIKVALGYSYSEDVVRAVNCARLAEQFEEPRLTADELAVLFSVADAERCAIERGDGCSPKLKYCSGGYFWPKSRTSYLAYKRLGTHRRGEEPRSTGTGLGLLHPYNGYVRLTRAGWALVLALEAQGARK